MVEIGHRPILWHILKIYAHYGYSDFLIALGYKGEHIKRYMAEYASLATDMTVDLAHRHRRGARAGGEPEDWRVTLIDTGSAHGDRRANAAGSRRISTARHS